MKSNALPTLTSCPICRANNQLLILLDGAVGGEWAFCRECKFAGDMITLAAQAWKLGIRNTLRKMAAQANIDPSIGDPCAADIYDSVYYTQWLQIENFWQSCQRAHVTAETSGLRMLQQRFGAARVTEEWTHRAGRFLGSCFKRDVDATFNPKRYGNWEEVKSKRSGGYYSQIFKGPKWNELLVVPFYDLPGRICGFLYIGRDASIETDYLYKSTVHEARDGGLAMLSSLMEGPHNHFGHAKFVFTDVDIALRFHVRHSKDHNRMLPLAATWDDGNHITHSVWDWFHPTNLIFWGVHRLKTIVQARKANGMVSTLNITRIELDTNMRNYSPVEWLDRIRVKAIPWVSALQEYLTPLDDLAIDEAFLLLDLRGQELTTFIAGCEPTLRDRLQYISEHKSFANKIKFESHWVHEKEDGWYLEKQDERISNAVVHIENVLTTLDNRSYYRGSIKFNGQSYPFTEKATTLSRGMLEWAQAYLRDHAKAGLSTFYPSWNKKSIQLAIDFSRPKYAQGVEVMGWDQLNRQFNFPQFAIQPGGEITTDFSCLFDNDMLPARDLPPPGMFPRKHIDDLSERNDETQIFWATAACVAANIVSGAVNRNQLPIILSGEGAQGVGCSAASRLGCLTIPTQTLRHGQPVPRQLQSPKEVCGWPSVMAGVLDPSQFDWLDQEQAKNCIFNLQAMAGKVLAIRGRANLIVQQRKLGSLQLLHHAAPYVLPNYIQDLYQRNIFLPDEQPDLARDVLHDMASWFDRIGGDRESVEAAIQVMHTPHSKTATDYFCELVFQLFEEGVLSFGRTGFNTARGGTAIVLIDDQEHLMWISQDRFSDAVKQVCGIAPDLLLISRSLADSEILVNEPAHKHEHGWLVRESWWNLQLQTWRTANGYALA